MKFLKEKKKLIISAVIIVAVAAVVIAGVGSIRNKKTTALAAETTEKVTKGSIKVDISGSGVIEPVERYDITALVNGNIIESPFEEGQMVKKGDILYKFDATELEGNIQKTKNSISRLELNDQDIKESLRKTIVYAGTSGNLTNFNVKANETIGNTKIGEIADNNYCIARVPFSQAQISQIRVGQSATVYSSALMSSIDGTVSKVSGSPAKKAGGIVLYDVEISISGVNTLMKDSEVTAVIGNIESPAAGIIDMPESYPIIPEISGRVKKVYVSNNDYVVKGQKLLEIEGDSYIRSLSKSSLDMSDLKITLGSQLKQLDDYNIKSPIDGVVLSKNNKAGDSIYAGANSVPLMVVADMSKVKFDMKIDELDIAKMKIGQTVNVSADAIPGKEFIGKITSIAGEGTAANGVSNYLVQVTITEPGELKPGMNVTAKTIVAEKDNVLLVPAAAVWEKDGKSYVTLAADSNGKHTDVNVQIGVNNKNLIEIVGGLREGDSIVIPANREDNAKAAGARVMVGGGSRRMGGM